MSSLLLFKQSCERYSFDQISPLVEASKRNILEWHLSIWQFPGRHSWIMTLTRTARAQDSQSLIPKGKSGEVVGESWYFGWSLPGPAGGVERLSLRKLALCQSRFWGWQWAGSGFCQLRRRKANWLSAVLQRLMAKVVPSLQSLRWPMALAPPAWQLDFQLPQVELSDCRIFLQGQREHIVYFFFPSLLGAPAQQRPSHVPWCKYIHVPMATFWVGRTAKLLTRGKSKMGRCCRTRGQQEC